ncbi:thiamine phosphate synthase [Pullulanibacillus sp. KACC 23026]|uniref:thiamine phosphate synthase n=1 Tax=Pullulanibacillus sp. KACC 23026 TaxID=3028315 RepID=UPI0023AFE6A1|nr:thiamine phosphate synthase [Pullulanibacillus sp. KACC 23026]WEG14639.1 thiamine phosphate synthase [Pullulanibacillus sp. KACC 23026]
MAKRSPEAIKELLNVYFIMGSPNCNRDPRDILKEAIQGGITLFQFREKGTGSLEGEAKRQLAKDLQAICKQHQIPFIVNDDLDLALELDADGVHIGQEDAPARDVRQRLGEEKLVGISAHTVEEALSAIQEGADYLGVGPIYPTTTKEDAKPARGMELVQTLRQKGISFPIVGIGGINPANASDVIEEGADGVSVITAISQAEHVVQTTNELKKAVHQIK